MISKSASKFKRGQTLDYHMQMVIQEIFLPKEKIVLLKFESYKFHHCMFNNIIIADDNFGDKTVFLQMSYTP